MSFILDALKKSEAERLRKDAPGFADLPARAGEKPASHWMWIVAALVVINIGVLAALYMKSDGVEATATHAPGAGPAPDPALSADDVPADAMPGRPAETTVATEPASPRVAEVAPPVGDTAPEPAQEEPPRVSESYATFEDLRAQGALQLPDIHLDIHVYSSNPEDRFVFVNMTKYKEKSTLDEGPVVREITPDGVILDYRQTRFLLPRK